MPPKRKAGGKKTLWCYIEGDTSAFGLTVSLSITIDDLKNKILEKKNAFLQGVNDLSLWKVRHI
jgi:hypothetical protein